MKYVKFLLLAAVLLIAGCAATGAPFQRVTQIPNDKGLIYVYRPDSIIGGAVHYDVHAGETEVICDLIRGGYCLHYAKPGELELWGKTESRSSITVDVKTGQELFVKGGLSLGFIVGRPNFSVVPNDVGLQEIKDCKLLLKPAEEPAKPADDSGKGVTH